MKWVSASDVGRAKYCPKALELKYSGHRPSEKAIEAMKHGDRMHQVFNDNLASDSRCYIANHIYGQHHPKTEFLRHFRDSYLYKIPMGKILVQVYYFVSPLLIKAFKDNVYFNKFSEALLNKILILLKY